MVTPAGEWPTTGAELLRAGLADAGRRGAVQAVVVTGHLDQPKREALHACGLEPASEWWVTPQGLRGELADAKAAAFYFPPWVPSGFPSGFASGFTSGQRSVSD